MIYFLLEFCLNSLNGDFFGSADRINSSYAKYSLYSPFISLYVGMVGINTLDLSFILAQLLFLFKLYDDINQSLLDVIKNLSHFDEKNSLYKLMETVFSTVPLFPFMISFVLNSAYISNSKKCFSLLSRILYTLGGHVSSTLFYNFLFIKISEFILSFATTLFFAKFYLGSQIRATSLILSYTGTYFFLKTAGKLNNKYINIVLGTKHDFSLVLEKDQIGLFDSPGQIKRDSVASYLFAIIKNVMYQLAKEVLSISGYKLDFFSIFLFLAVFLTCLLVQTAIKSIIIKVQRKKIFLNPCDAT